MPFLNLCSSLVGDFGTYRQHSTIQINSEKAGIPNYKAELKWKALFQGKRINRQKAESKILKKGGHLLRA